MVNPSSRAIAQRYCVDDLPGASLPGARLQNILDCLERGKPVTALSLAFLEKQGLESLHLLATGMLAYDIFRERALTEQYIRVEAAKADRLAKEAEEQARKVAMQEKARLAFEQAEAARLARESDPKYIAKLKNQNLRSRYGLDSFIEQHCFRPLMAILRCVDAGKRLSPNDFVWLSSAGEDYFTEELQIAYHRLEAKYFADEFKKTRDPWAAVNASSHFRKCDGARHAASILATIRVEQQKTNKLKSALCTTHGGVMRDLGHLKEALQLGEKAHAFRPDDYRPCTLLGAVHMETGNYSLGQEWYAMAVERGATVDSVDQDLRSIFYRASHDKRKEMRDFLLREDPVRYAWREMVKCCVCGP